MCPRTVRNPPDPWQTEQGPTVIRVSPDPLHARHVSRLVTVTVRASERLIERQRQFLVQIGAGFRVHGPRATLGQHLRHEIAEGGRVIRAALGKVEPLELAAPTRPCLGMMAGVVA